MYKAILIDMFNLGYRLHKKNTDYKLTANAVINFINDEVDPRVEATGSIYLLFDPLPKSDLGMNKNFKYHPTRQQISSGYKSHREKNPVVYDAMNTLRKYYTYKGERYKTVICNNLEADDFVEGILQIEDKGNIALVTTDSDWSRYISDRVEMINKGFNNPYTKEDYYKEFKMNPTITVITLKKALYGDESDEIKSVVSSLGKKLNFYTDVDTVINAMLTEISRDNTPLDEVIDKFKRMVFIDLIQNHDRDNFEELAYTLMSADSDNGYNLGIWETFLNNIRIIKCRCLDVTKYIHWKNEDKGYNTLMDTNLGRIKRTNKSHKVIFGLKK